MVFTKWKMLLREAVSVIGVTVAVILLVEITAWLFVPGRYQNPPAVTADAWISSDALAREDTIWMKEYVDEFCRSYVAHWTSYVYFKRNAFSGKYINIDSNGVRYTPRFSLRTAGEMRTVRVLLLGGSTMWGTGARDSGTIPSALSRLIAADRAFAPAEVVNLGESGYVSTQSVIRLELELRNGSIPDIVILYDGVNDVFAAYQDFQAGLPQNEQHRVLEFNLLTEGALMRRLGLQDILNRTLTAELLNAARSVVSSPPPAAPQLELGPDIVRCYQGNLDIMDALSHQFGFHYLAYWQPVIFTQRNPTPYQQGQSEKMQYVRPLFQEVYGLIGQDSLLRRNTWFHDISDIFNGVAAPMYLDFAHISETGNAIIARRIYDDLKNTFHYQRPTAPPEQ